MMRGTKTQPDRDCARSRLHQPERVRPSLPPRRRPHADGVSPRIHYEIDIDIPLWRMLPVAGPFRLLQLSKCDSEMNPQR